MWNPFRRTPKEAAPPEPPFTPHEVAIATLVENGTLRLHLLAICPSGPTLLWHGPSITDMPYEVMCPHCHVQHVITISMVEVSFDVPETQV